MIHGDEMHLRAMVATPDGQRVAVAEVRGAATQGAELAAHVTTALAAQNAEEILAVCKAQTQD